MSISMQELLEAGAHYGHQTHRWNPKMKPYIYGARNGIYIINLEKTVFQWNKAREAILKCIASGQKILFIGTKPQAQDILQEEATRASQYFVNRRWLGGMLTNFKTIRSRIERMAEIERIKSTDEQKHYSKKELVEFDKEFAKLEKCLSGIKDMKSLPGLVILVDPKMEHIAIQEARKLRIPVMAVTDTNCDPDGIDFVIPANDDALKSIRLFLHDAADACLEGSKAYEMKIQEESKNRSKADAEAKAQKAISAQEAKLNVSAAAPVA